MRSATAGELTTLAKLEREVTKRVKVANGSGTMIDLTSWVEDTGNDIDIDRPASALTVLFRRDSGTTLSLSPLRTDSTLNRLDDGSTYSPQLQGGRRITWEEATTSIGTALAAGDFKLLFDGFIDVIDFDHSPIACDCRDKGGVLVDRGIEVEAAYGSGAGVALETVMQGVLDATFGGGVIPLDTPVSPSYLVSPAYIQQRQSMMDAMQALAQLPGWDARYWYDTASASFKFRLQQPPRTKTVPDYTFGPSAYYGITRLSIDRTNIKNVIAVSYFDTTANARLVVTVSDATSITKYGRRYFYLQETDGSPINTNAEATSMANAMLSDMKEPKAEAEIELPFFWPAELWDLYRFTANGVHINSDQDWAVVSINHKLGRRHHRTVLTVRGAPAGGYLTWLDRPKIAGGEHRPGEVGPEPKIEVFGPLTATQAQVLYTATGGTAPLTYQRRIDVDDVSTGTYSAPAALGSGVTEWITLHAGDRATRVFLRVIDATGLQGNADPFFLPGQNPATNPTTGKIDPAIELDGGGGIFIKEDVADPDDLDGIPDGATHKRVVGVVSSKITPASSTARNRCLVYGSGNWSTTDLTDLTMDFDSESWDVGGLHSTATNPSRITIPTGGNTGTWHFIATVVWAANASGIRSVNIRKNGAGFRTNLVAHAATASALSQQLSVWDSDAAVGDYYQVVVFQTSGGNLDAVGGSALFSTFAAVHLW